MPGPNIGFGAAPGNLAPWPGSASAADLATETANRQAADTTLQNNINALPQPAKLAADVTNANSAVRLDMGFSVPVVAGTVKSIRAILFVTTAGAGGISVQVLHPAVTNYMRRARANAASANATSDDTVTTAASPDTFSTYLTYTGSGLIIIDVAILPSANGNVTFTFTPVTNTQTMTIRAGSYVSSI